MKVKDTEFSMEYKYKIVYFYLNTELLSFDGYVSTADDMYSVKEKLIKDRKLRGEIINIKKNSSKNYKKVYFSLSLKITT